jgi:hypothetical protein
MIITHRGGQMPKEIGQNDKQLTAKHSQKTKD